MEHHHNEENQMLWKIAGFKKDIIKDCKADGHHATMIGILLVVIGIYACIAWSIFFSSVVGEWLFAIPLGLFMGLFIFFLDRALISSLAKSKQNVSFQYLASAGFRLLLAILYQISYKMSLLNIKRYYTEVYFKEYLYDI